MFHWPLVLCFGLQNINRNFVPTSKPLNMLGGTLFVACFLASRFFLLFSSILTSNCINRTYLVAVYTLNTGNTPCCLFVRTKKVPFIFHAMIWTSKQQQDTFPSSKPQNMLDGTLFVVCLPLNTLFVLFSGILICNCIRRIFAVYTQNTPSTAYCSFLTAENVRLTFGVILWPWKYPPYLCSNFKTSKHVRRYLVCYFLLSLSTVFLHFNL